MDMESPRAAQTGTPGPLPWAAAGQRGPRARFRGADHPAPVASDVERTPVPISLGIVGAGQFAGHFATLFALHPGVTSVVVTDVLRERAVELDERLGLDGVVDSFEALLE